MSYDNNKMDGEQKACVLVIATVTSGLVALAAMIGGFSQISAERDANIRINAIKQGYTCNRVAQVVGSSVHTNWVCEK